MCFCEVKSFWVTSFPAVSTNQADFVSSDSLSNWGSPVLPHSPWGPVGLLEALCLHLLIPYCGRSCHLVEQSWLSWPRGKELLGDSWSYNVFYSPGEVGTCLAGQTRKWHIPSAGHSLAVRSHIVTGVKCIPLCIPARLFGKQHQWQTWLFLTAGRKKPSFIDPVPVNGWFKC